MKLLIVDDEIITIEGIRKGVDWSALPLEEVLYATSAQEARSIIQKDAVDIMLCDIEMPKESGLDLLTWIRDENRQIECIFLTCHEEFSFVQKALKLQGMDYLLKPVPYEELQEILRNACQRVQEKQTDRRYQELARAMVQEDSTQNEREHSNAERIVETVKHYISTHLDEDLSAELLAREAFVSTAYLFKVFKQIENRTLVDYITDTRLFYAAEMLRNPDSAIGRVAVSAGYNNYAYFTKVFKKKSDMTPSQYQRKMMLENSKKKEKEDV